MATMWGVGAGYLAYDMTHYWCHHGRNLPWFIEAQKRVHMAHHYRDHRVTYGISSPLFDYIFCTVGPAKEAQAKAH